MKTIAVIANEKKFADYIKNNLDVYLDGKARIRSYSVKELDGIALLREDMVLLSANTIFLKVFPKISEDSIIMNYAQTLSTDNAEVLREAYDEEPFDRAYLVNIDYRLCTNVIRELYDVGFQHIEFIPFSGDSDELDESVKVAVTPDEEIFVPKGIKRVINIGQRVIDVECIVEICDKLDIDLNEILNTKAAKKAMEHISDKGRLPRHLIALKTDKGRRVYNGRYDARFHFRNIVGSSDIIKKKIEIAKRMAGTDASVLITGESGTGKEIFAQSIHNSSKRKNYNFVAINCAAIPESLFESELFGYDEGAFTGAKKTGKAGYFELAHKGTLFLDEIGEMPLSLQGKLLRAIEERRVVRVGSSKLIDVDVRLIASTNQKLEELVREKKFRSDLYFRLNVLPLSIPPLKERKGDILEILYYLRDQYDGKWELSDETKYYLENYSWPGNIRELRNVVQYLDSLGIDKIERGDLPELIGDKINLEITGAQLGDRTLEKFDGNNDDKSQRKQKNGDLEFKDFILSEGKTLDIFSSVLSLLSEMKCKGVRMGREQITRELRARGEDYTESEIRTALRKLSEQGFILSKKGRSGSRINDKGTRLLIEINNVIKGA